MPPLRRAFTADVIAVRRGLRQPFFLRIRAHSGVAQGSGCDRLCRDFLRRHPDLLSSHIPLILRTVPPLN